MEPGTPLTSAHGMRLLAAFLRETDSRRLPAEVANEAISEWIARQRGQLPDIVVASAANLLKAGGTAAPNGYRWKTIFLPDGTRLRMQWSGSHHDALIQDGNLVFDGRPMSPRQMTIAVAGKGYNAWRTLWLLLPGATRWKSALQLRHEVEHYHGPRVVSPHEAMAAAAECMAETLRSALALVDHASGRVLPQAERRTERKRRASDAMEDACRLD